MEPMGKFIKIARAPIPLFPYQEPGSRQTFKHQRTRAP